MRAWKVFSDHPQLAVAKKEVYDNITQARASHTIELSIMTLVYNVTSLQAFMK